VTTGRGSAAVVAVTTAAVAIRARMLVDGPAAGRSGTRNDDFVYRVADRGVAGRCNELYFGSPLGVRERERERD
jgi:hypothetical protein